MIVRHAGREASHGLCEVLLVELADFAFAEGGRRAVHGVAHAHVFCDDDVLLFHEAVAGGEDGQHVTVELQAGQHDAQADEIGQEEAGQLYGREVASQEFPE